jgi:prophage regulatory protein
MATHNIRFHEVMARTGLGRSSIDLLEKRGEFPRRVRVGARAVRWDEDEITGWLQARLNPDIQ